MKIRKAVVAAAGWGTRFFPAVKNTAKQMIPVLSKPVIQLILEELVGAGIDRIAVVHRHGDSSIRQYFKENPDLRKYLRQTGKEEFILSWDKVLKAIKTLRFYPQHLHLPYGNASPVLVCKAFVGNDPFVYVFADDVTLEKRPGDYIKHLISVFEKYHPAIAFSAERLPWSEIHTCGSIKYKKGSKIPNQAEGVFEKLPADQAPSNWAQMGRFVCDAKKVFAVLADQKVSRANELWFADTVNTLCQKDIVIAEKMPKSVGHRITTGDPLNWLKANIEFGLQDEKIAQELKKYFRSFSR